MEVEINNFRSISSSRYNFTQGVTLINGESGKGKTTILESIFWCLYGGKNVYPFNSNKEKGETRVSLKINDIFVNRSKPPDTVSLTIGKAVYVHDEAQKQIERIFGSQSYWECSSYLKQDNRNILMMYLNPSEKIKILKEFIFGKSNEDVVENYYSKINSAVTGTDKEIDSEINKVLIYQGILKESSKKLQNYKTLDKQKYKKIYENSEKIEKEVEKLTKQIDELNKSASHNETLKNMKETMEKAEKKLNLFPSDLTFEKIKMWEVYSREKAEIKKIKMDFEIDYSNIEDVIVKLKKLEKNQENYEKNQILSSKTGIEYNKKIIEQEIRKLETTEENILKFQKYKTSIENIKKIKDEINLQENKVLKLEENSIFDTIENLEKEKDQLEVELVRKKEFNKLKELLDDLEEDEKELLNKEKEYREILKILDLSFQELTSDVYHKIIDLIESYSGNYLECPKCNSYLIKKQDRLTVIDRKPFTCEKRENLKEKITTVFKFQKRLREKKKRIEEKKSTITYEVLDISEDEISGKIKKISNFIGVYSKEKEKLKVLKKTVASLKIPEEVNEINENIKSVKDKIYKLKKIDFFTDFSSELEKTIKKVENIEKTKKLKTTEDNITNNYQRFYEDYETPQNYEKYYSEYKDVFQKYNFTKEYMSNHYEICVDGEVDSLIGRKKNLEKMTVMCRDYEKYLEIEKDEEKIDDSKEKLKSVEIKKNNCLKIKKLIDESSNETLENLITEMNDLLNEISRELFEDIIIELEMFKKIKSKKDLKPQFNLLIYLSGNKYENISFLSGGEKDRISISLTLALSIISNNPVVLLDECMSSLDEDMRLRVLKLIKKYLSNKIIINVCHDSVKGFYDNVIEI